MRVGTKHPTNAEILHNIQTPLSSFVLGHKRLWPAQANGYVVLGEFRVLSRLNQQAQQSHIFIRVDRLQAWVPVILRQSTLLNLTSDYSQTG
jgi:hypothetical protein